MYVGVLAMTSRATQKYGDHSIHMEWQSSEKYPYEYRTVKRRRRKYGEFRRYDDGSITYWAFRKANESVYRENAWALDVATFSLIRMFGKPDIGIEVDNGDTWLTTFEVFDANKTRWDYSGHIGTLYGSKGKFGAVQWMLKFEHWQYRRGSSQQFEKAIKIGKWK